MNDLIGPIFSFFLKLFWIIATGAKNAWVFYLPCAFILVSFSAFVFFAKANGVIALISLILALACIWYSRWCYKRSEGVDVSWT